MKPRHPTIAVVAALVLLVVQFGVVQHAFEHGTPSAEVGCSFCVAAAQPATLHAAAFEPPRPAAFASFASDPVPHLTQRVAARFARGPPSLHA